MAAKVDLTGMVFGRLTVLDDSGERDSSGRVKWLCACSCGKSHKADGGSLQYGLTRSCGCLTKERCATGFRRTHGHAAGKHSSTFMSWCNMRRRCADPSYKYYGEKGIKVCERWQDFDNFLADMGAKPVDGWHIDRIDPDKDYEPSNCEWVSASENARRMNAAQKAKRQLADKRP